MNEQVNRLIDVLATQESHYRHLLSLMDKEKRATMRSDAEALNAVVVQKQELMATLAALDKQRLGLLHQMAGQWRLRPSELDLDTISKYTNKNNGIKIKRLGVSLGKLLPEVQKANDENRALIQHCLQLVQNTLGFFQHWLAPGHVYGSKGRVNDGALSGKLLSGTV